MTSSNLVTIAFPLVLGLIMFGLGTSLTSSDFWAVRRSPKALLVGLAVQMLLGPLLALALIQIFSLTGNIAFGLLLLSVVPGGTTSSLYSHLARGDVALNISLTALNSFLGIVSIPAFLYMFSQFYFQGPTRIEIPIQKLIQTILIVLLPVVFGMLLRRRHSHLAKQFDPWVRKIAVVFIAVLAILGIKNEWSVIQSTGLQVIGAAIVFNLLNLAMAYLVSRSLRLSHIQTIAVTFEVGVHNCLLAIGIALAPHLFNSLEMALPAIFYSLFTQISALLLVQLFRRKNFVA
jgi:BASS family bile acid:Na+ symporter